MKHLKHFFSRKETTLFAVALLVGIGASIVLWQVVSPGHRYEQSNNPTERSHTFTQPNSSTIQSTSTTIALNTILELESPTDRTIAIYTLVGGMNGEQIDELLNKTLDFNPSTLVQSVQATLLAELTWLDPAKAWSFVEETDTQRSENFVSTVFAEWAQFNLHEALQETSKLGRAMKNRALQAIFFSRPDLPVADRVTLVEQHGGRPTLLRRLTTEVSTNQSLDQPFAALQTIIGDEIDDELQIISLYELTDSWYDREGLTSIGDLLDQFYKSFQDQYRVLRDLVKKVAAFDPETAWNHVLTLPFEAQRKLAPMVVSKWGAIDFEKAHRAVLETNIPSVLGNLFQSVARAEPERALAELDQVPKDVALTVYVHLVDKLPRETLLKHLTSHGNLGPNTPLAVRLLIDSWSSQDSEACVEWVLANLPVYDWITPSNLLKGLTKLGSVDVERAFAIALGQPKKESAPGMEYSVVATLAQNGRFEGLVELLEQVREPMRRRAYEVVGIHFSESGRLNEAIELANQLPESDWPDYFQSITSTGVWEDSELFIEKMSLFPSKSIRIQVALHIVDLVEMAIYPNRLSITDSDLQYLRSVMEGNE